MSTALTVAELQEVLQAQFTAPLRQPTLVIEGPPGLGKTAAVRQAAAAAGRTLYRLVAPCRQPYELDRVTALPGPGEDRARQLPVGDLARALLDHSAESPCVVLIDELGQADPDVQKAARGLLHREDGELPAWVQIVAATNRRQDRSGASHLLAHVQNAVIGLTVRYDVDSWTRWACAQPHIPAAMVAHSRWRGDAWVTAEVPATAGPFPSPRSWESAALSEGLALRPELEEALLAGAVGEGPALDYLSFRCLYTDAVYSDQVFADPATAPLPAADKPAMAAGLMASLAARLIGAPTLTTAASFATYVARLVDDGRAEFAAFGLRLARQDSTAAGCLSMSKPAQMLLADPRVCALVTGADL